MEIKKINYLMITAIIIVAIGALISVRSLYFFDKDYEEKNNSLEPNMFEEKLLAMRNELTGINMNSLKSVLGDALFRQKQEKIIFLYTGFDCGNCIEDGFELVKSIKSSDTSKDIYVIASNTNIGSNQIAYDYHDFIYNDHDEKIRSELKYIYTPVFLSVDSTERINALYFPTTFKSNDDYRMNFLQKISGMY